MADAISQSGGDTFGLSTDTTLEVDGSRCVVKCIVSTENPDRADDVIHIAGIDLSKHEKNAVVLYAHQRWGSGIASAWDADKNYTVKKQGKILIAESHFPQSLAFSMEVFKLIDAKVINGVSIGGDSKNFQKRVDKSGYPTGGVEVFEMELHEYSHVVLGENGEAVVLAVEKGINSRQLSDPMKKILYPIYKSYKDKQNPIEPSGFVPPVVEVKKMADEEEKPILAGQKCLKAYHKMLKSAYTHMSKSAGSQENPSVKEFCKSESDALQERMDGITKVHKEAYDGDFEEDSDDKEVEKFYKQYASDEVRAENEKLKKEIGDIKKSVSVVEKNWKQVKEENLKLRGIK